MAGHSRTEDGHTTKANNLRSDHDQERNAESQRQQPRLQHQHRREQRARQQVVTLRSTWVADPL
jgi:hypothetical protein